MTFLVPQTKVPMELWWHWSDVVYDQMRCIESTLSGFEEKESAVFFRTYCDQLQKLWHKTVGREDADSYRDNFVEIYAQFLHRLPETAERLQILMGEDWRNGLAANEPNAYKTERGAQIFGFPDLDNPRGIADGWPHRGYLTQIMCWLLVGNRGHNYFGTLKPRMGVTVMTNPVDWVPPERKVAWSSWMKNSYLLAKVA